VETKNNTLDKSEINIYPNPATHLIQLKSNERITEVTIYNLEARLVLNEQSNSIKELNVSSLKKGMYLLSVKTKQGIISRKLIID